MIGEAMIDIYEKMDFLMQEIASCDLEEDKDRLLELSRELDVLMVKQFKNSEIKKKHKY